MSKAIRLRHAQPSLVWSQHLLGPLLLGLLLLGLLFLSFAGTQGQVQASPQLLQSDFECNAVSQIPAAECNALVALYSTTGGDSWANNDGWLTTETPCDWYGIQCNSEGHVHQIFLDENQLVGPIPPEIGDLTELTWLQLNGNQLSGPIPPQLGQLTQVTWLRLEFNELTGTIPPELATMSELDSLYLADNQLTGSIPPELGKFPHLYKLNLSFTQLSGPIPPELANLSTLESLILNNTALEGPLPASFASLENLTFFHYLNTAICTPEEGEIQAWLQSIPELFSPEIACGSQELNLAATLPASPLAPGQEELPEEPPQAAAAATAVSPNPTEAFTATAVVVAPPTSSLNPLASTKAPNDAEPSSTRQLSLLTFTLLLLMVGGIGYGWWIGQSRE